MKVIKWLDKPDPVIIGVHTMYDYHDEPQHIIVHLSRLDNTPHYIDLNRYNRAKETIILHAIMYSTRDHL